MTAKDAVSDLPILLIIGVFLPWIINLLQDIRQELRLIEEYLRPAKNDDGEN